METKDMKQSFWDSWILLHKATFKNGGISDFELFGLVQQVKEKTIEVVDLLTKIENHTSTHRASEINDFLF